MSFDVNYIGVSGGVIIVLGCRYMQWEILHIDIFVNGYWLIICGFVYEFSKMSIVVWLRLP